MPLPTPPNIKVYPIEKSVPDDANEFLKIKRQWYVANYQDGSNSPYFLHDVVERKHIDAAVIIAYFKIHDAYFVHLRSALRPAIFDRFTLDGCLWELPAGLIEGEEEPKETAARETMEELGFKRDAGQFEHLGQYSFPAVGLCSERLFYFMIEVDPSEAKIPTLDGSPLEKNGKIITISLNSAKRAIKEGSFKDAKTELGLRRFIDTKQA